MAAVCEVRGLAKRYGDRVALFDVDLEVPAGRVVALLGRNGAGKSTLVGAVAGLLRPDRGGVRVMGQDPSRAGVRERRRIGLAAQEIGVYPGLTVEQNLRAFGEVAGLSRRAARRRAGEVAEPFGLAPLLGRRAGQLSGGEQRRLHSAAAVVHEPPFVILDEPTAGADAQTRAAIVAVVGDMAARGVAVLYASHYFPEVEALGADVAILDRGRVVASGGLDALVERHGQHALVLSFEDGERLRLPCDRPAAVLPRVLERLGGHARRLAGVEVVRPSLEDVYLRLTGAPIAPGEPEGAVEGPAGPAGAVEDPAGGEGPGGGSDVEVVV
ncbi:MAG: ABC transporter ATP-binding protein [Acidimicrobiia bacterium]